MHGHRRIYGQDADLVPGVYDSLVTLGLDARLAEWDRTGHSVERRSVDDAEAAHLLGRFIGDAAADALAGVKDEAARVVLANRLLSLIASSTDTGDTGISTDAGGDGSDDVPSGPDSDSDRDQRGAALTLAADDKGRPDRLLSLVRAGEPHPARPSTALSEAALLTNAAEDPNLAHELKAELATADSVDLLCAFVKWSGLRILEEELARLAERGVKLRVITTTYMGATERGALDRLVTRYGAEVRINYEQRSTRLHAKAWLLRRRTGFDTAYIGSSNLSRAALLDGLEWNVRLSAVTTPRLIDKFEGTFDSYWNRDDFEPYDPRTDADAAARLDEALRRAGAGPRGASLFDLPTLAPHPYPHQRQILEDLDVARRVHDRHRNLVVAATGTGKTVVAAFDYRNLARSATTSRAEPGSAESGPAETGLVETGPAETGLAETGLAETGPAETGPSETLPSLLFVAHRKEILEQALHTYRQVLAAPTFGELHVGEYKATRWRHVFASVQSLSPAALDRLAPSAFDTVVIDEFHHAEAPTYRRLIDHFSPRELLGLTATPERTDGVRVQDAFFDGRIASELRLWDALEADLLCPFHYFGVNDDTDLRHLAWSAGRYETAGLDGLFTGNTARARLVFNALRDKVGAASLGSVRGLGFCASVGHARFMAEFFSGHGLPSRAVSADTAADERHAALAGLRDGSLTFLFAVDLFNEGVDLPDVDTLLLLRPTESATVFLQQLGRGLRRTEDKPVLTVLDFVGQHRREYRLEERFAALTGFRRARLADQAEKDFPLLPSGSQIVLDRIAKQRVLGALRERVGANVNELAREVRSSAEVTLAGFLEANARDVRDVYRANRSWTTLLRRGGLLPGEASALEEQLVRRMRALVQVDDEVRAAAYARLLDDGLPRYDDLSAADQAYTRMLFFSLWRDGGGFESYDEGLAALRRERAICEEIRQLAAYGAHRPRHVAKPLDGPLADLPLAVNASYTQEEVLAAIGYVGLGPGGKKPAHFREGVAFSPSAGCDALFVTLHKSAEEFSPQTMYRDYALSPRLFHWESQHRIGPESPTGTRYRAHRERGTHVLLFTRQRREEEGSGPEPFAFHGLVDYLSHTGDRPMAIQWELRDELPTEFFRRAAIAS